MAGSRRHDEQATTPEPQPGIQGEGRIGPVKGETTLAKLAQQHDIHPNLITQRRAKLLESAADVFGAEQSAAERAVASPPILEGRAERALQVRFCDCSERRG